MRSGKYTRRPSAWRLLLLAFLFSVCIGDSAGFAVSAKPAANDATEVLLAANRLERLVTDLETGQLGYVATGDSGSLLPWHTARAAFPRQAALLQQLAADSTPDQARRAQEIVRAASAYLHEHAEPLVRTARHNRASARTLVVRAEGRHRIDALRHQFDRFAEVQHGLAVAHERDAVPAVRRVIATTAGASGSLLLAFLLVGYVRRTRDRDLTRGRRAGAPFTGLRSMSGERDALRHLAGLIADDASPAEVFATAADAMGRLLRADHTLVVRYEADGTAVMAGHWSAAVGSDGAPPRDGRWPVEDETVTDLVQRTGGMARSREDRPSAGAIGAWLRGNDIRRMTGCPIVAGDRLWGMAAALSRGHGRWPAEAECVLEEVADLVGVAVASAHRRAELASARVRLIEAADAARHRIERELHERAQQRLVSAGLELRTIEAAVPPDLELLRERLSGTAHSLNEISDDLREVARKLYPTFLRRTGLPASLRALARRSSVPVDLDLRAARRLPETIETTVYRLVSETLANAAAHSRASVVHVDLDLTGPVRLSIHDDGTGGARTGPGSALSDLKDRTEALGGTFTLDSPAGKGTTVRVSLPAEMPTAMTGTSPQHGIS